MCKGEFGNHPKKTDICSTSTYQASVKKTFSLSQHDINENAVSRLDILETPVADRFKFSPVLCVNLKLHNMPNY